MDEQYYTEQNLRQKQEDFKEKYGDIFLKLVDDDTGEIVERTINIAKFREKYPQYDDVSDTELLSVLQKKISEDEAKIKELKNRIDLFIPGLAVLIGVCAAAIGFFGVWLVYYSIAWVVLGFCDDEQKNCPETGSVMTLKEIAEKTKKAQDIDKMLESGERLQKARNLAHELGASTLEPYAQGKEANVGVIINNCYRVLQTMTMVNACKTAAKNYKIALTATIIAILAMLAAWVAVLSR